VSGRPVSLAGADGGLCPLGVTGHHLPYHPRRLRSGPAEEARTAADAALARGARPAVLDLRPGRPFAEPYAKAMAERNGFYVTPPEPPAVDLSAARTVISLGAPLLEGWLPPARVFAMRDRFRLIQIEPYFSRTAALADEWLPACADVAALARSSEPPVLIIDPTKREGAGVTSVPDASIGVLYIDESGPGAYVPWFEIAPKLAPGAVVVALTWWRDGYARHTHLAVPTPVYPEPELMKPPEWAVDPVKFIVGQALSPANRRLAGGSACPTISTPLFSKLYQESGLLLAPGQVAVAPSAGFDAKERAYLAGPRGRLAAEVVLDAGLPPGCIRFVPTPETLDLFGSEEPKVVRA
jgi:hypothetical protein